MPFQKILEEKCIWFSDLSKSNDKTEGRYIKDIFRKAWYKFVGEPDFSQEVFEFFDKFLDSYIIFGLCTSKNGNLLSQWRGYADDGRGFSIGFEGDLRGSQLDNNLGSRFPLNEGEVEYEEKHQIDNLKSYIREILQRCDINGIQKDKFLAPERYEVSPLTLLGCFGPIIKEIAYTIKHPAFSEEDEVRFFFQLPDNDSRKMDCKFFTRPSMIVPYIPVPLSELPRISKVFIGPKNDTAKRVAELILETEDFSGVDVIKSNVPYR